MYDMTIRLQQNSEKCLYEQIYEYIRDEVELPEEFGRKEKIQPSSSMIGLYVVLW